MKAIIIVIAELLILTLVSALLIKQKQKTKWPYTIENDIKRIVLIGLIFGVLGFLFLQLGYNVFHENASTADVVVLVAALLFEPGAGIVTGILVALGWVSVSNYMLFPELLAPLVVINMLAGVGYYFFRKYLYENKTVSPMHCTMIYTMLAALEMLTYLSVTTKNKEVDIAFVLIRYFTGPVIVVSFFGIIIVSTLITLLRKEKLFKDKKETSITQTIQSKIILALFIAFLLTTSITIIIENELCLEQSEMTMQFELYDIQKEIKGFSDEVVKKDALEAANYIKSGGSISSALGKYNASEINIINSKGQITDSTNSSRIGIKLNEGDKNDTYQVFKGQDVYCDNYKEESRYDKKVGRKYVEIKNGDGFIELGYDASYFQPLIDDMVRTVATNRHVGQTGYLVVLDNNWNIVSADEYFILSLGSDYFSKRTTSQNQKKENTRYETEIEEIEYFYMIVHAEGYSVSAMYPKSEAYQMIWKFMLLGVMIQIIVFGVLYTLIFISLKKNVIHSINKINDSLSKISDGELDEKVDVYTNIEFSKLSDDINKTVDTLKGYIAEAAARIDNELQFARNIQSSALPSSEPAFPDRDDFEIHAIMQAAREVGGDFYDFFITHRYILNFLVADVSGKSIPGAMFMMKAKATLKHLREAENSVDECFRMANEELCEGNDAGMFVTAWMTSINLMDGKMYYANAGHNPPLIRREGGRWEFIKSKVNFVLAGMEGSQYLKQELDLDPGDELLLYTDGVTEATNINNELYGEQRLLDFMNSCEYSSMKEFVKKIEQDVMDFTGEAQQFDDITILGFRYIGNEPILVIHDDDAEISDIPYVTSKVESCLNELGCPKKAIVQLNIAIDEFYSNIAKYAYGDNKGPVDVTLERTQARPGVILSFIDEGMPFNPLSRQNPNVTLSAEDRKIGGLGIFMVKNQMDDLFYEYRDDKNIVRMVKFFD